MTFCSAQSSVRISYLAASARCAQSMQRRSLRIIRFHPSGVHELAHLQPPAGVMCSRLQESCVKERTTNEAQVDVLQQRAGRVRVQTNLRLCNATTLHGRFPELLSVEPAQACHWKIFA